MAFSQDRAELWHDETVHPGSTAILLAMQAVEADPDLVMEWRQHCAENYEESDWICYAEWLEVELEVTLDQLADVRVHNAIGLTKRVLTLLLELEKGVHHDHHLLKREGGVPAVGQPPMKILVQIPGAFRARVEVLEEEVTIAGWSFMPHASDAGYFGPDAIIDDVEPKVPGPELEGLTDFLSLGAVDGPLWRAVQGVLSDTEGRVQVQWTE